MYCVRCGTQNSEGATFCQGCGASLGGVRNAGPAETGAGQARPQGYAAGGSEGNVSAAWHDITGSQGWFKRVVALSLVNCVPILNFAVEGYCVRWARELSFGRRSSLPTAIFDKKTMSTGFFAMLVKLGLLMAFAIVSFTALFLLSGLFGLFSPMIAGVVGSFLVAVFWAFEVFFFSPVVDAGVMRMSVTGYLEAGFQFKRVWQVFRKGMGGLIGASILPRLAIGVVAGIVFTLLALIVTVVAGASVAQLASRLSGSGMSTYGMTFGGRYESPVPAPLPMGDLAGIAFGLGIGIVVLIVIAIILIALTSTLSTLFTYRAVGHWVSRVASDWAGEASPLRTESDQDNHSLTPVAAEPPVVPHPTGGDADDRTVWYAPQQPPRQELESRDSGTTSLADVGPRLALYRKSNGRTYDISSFPATVGKGSAASVRIEDNNAISRAHVRITFTGSAFVVEELGATNKTYLNGDCLSDGDIAVLHDGDELKLAEEAFTVLTGK